MSVLLAVDGARVSGVALFVEDKLTSFGEVTTPQGRDLEIQRALNVSQAAKLPLIFVIEDFGPHWKGHVAFKRACEARGRWVEWIEFHHGSYFNIEVDTWRDGIYGKRHHRGKPREQLKDLAILHARQRTKIRKPITHNVAEAILLGVFALSYPPVLRKLRAETELVLEVS